MKSLISILVALVSLSAEAAFVTPIRFQTEVVGFDKTWVRMKSKHRAFRVPRKAWEELNGPAHTGIQMASVEFGTFRSMTLDARLPAKK